MRTVPVYVLLLVLLGSGLGQVLTEVVAQQEVTQEEKGPVQGLDEMGRRKARLEKNPWPCANLEAAWTRADWQAETLCFTDIRTGREVWRMPATTVHNFITHRPVTGDFWVQSDGCTHCDWSAYADYAVVDRPGQGTFYCAADRAPEPKQPDRIASLPAGTTKYLDWLADPAEDGHYTVTSVDRQGNESPAAGF